MSHSTAAGVANPGSQETEVVHVSVSGSCLFSLVDRKNHTKDCRGDPERATYNSNCVRSIADCYDTGRCSP